MHHLTGSGLSKSIPRDSKFRLTSLQDWNFSGVITENLKIFEVFRTYKFGSFSAVLYTSQYIYSSKINFWRTFLPQYTKILQYIPQIFRENRFHNHRLHQIIYRPICKMLCMCTANCRAATRGCKTRGQNNYRYVVGWHFLLNLSGSQGIQSNRAQISRIC